MKKIIFVFALLSFSQLSFAQVNGGNPSGGTQPNDSMGAANAAEDEFKRENLEKFLNDTNYMSMKKARPAFASAFKDAQTAVMADDLKKTDTLIQKLSALKNLNNYEQARLYLINYWYYGKLGNKELENQFAGKLLALGTGNVDSEAYIEAGMRLLKRQYNNQDMGGAIETLTNLRKDIKSITDLNTIGSAVAKLDEIAAQQTDIIQKIRVNDSGSWNTKLLKSNFLFGAINGEIKEIEFNCANKQTKLTYKPDSVMSIPETWGACSIKVNAASNTTFSFVQLQNKPT